MDEDKMRSTADAERELMIGLFLAADVMFFIAVVAAGRVIAGGSARNLPVDLAVCILLIVGRPFAGGRWRGAGWLTLIVTGALTAYGVTREFSGAIGLPALLRVDLMAHLAMLLILIGLQRRSMRMVWDVTLGMSLVVAMVLR